MPQIAVPLAANFAGLDRLNAPQNLDASKSPDCTDCMASGGFTGKLGPRLGRQRVSSRTYPILGMGGFLTDSGEHWRVTAATDGVWSASEVPWSSPVTTTAILTGWDVINVVSLPFTGTAGATTNGTARPVGSFNLANYGLCFIRPEPYGGNYTYVAKAVTGGQITAGVATLTATAHGYATGDYVTVNTSDATGIYAYDGVYEITVTGVNTFTYVTTAGDRGPDVLTGSNVGNVGAFGENYSGELYLEGKVNGSWGRLATQLAALTGTLTDIRSKTVLDSWSQAISTTLNYQIYLKYGTQNSTITVP